MDWTENEELELVKLIKAKISIDEISKKHNRTFQEIEMRLSKIIYENIKDGKSIKLISNALNLSEEQINIYYEIYNKIKNQSKKQNIKHLPDENNQKINQLIDKIERENKFIKLILDNRELHQKLSEEIKNKKIDNNVKDIIHILRKQKI